jgi:EAL domain-containing protein (putative c-di-GMP-specific phosphodiesterase class I)
VLRGADLALYEAKARNGGVVAMFRPELDDRAVRRLELQEDLRAAIAKGEFRLLYQPIVSLYDGTTGGVEALIRWERPGVGLVSPVEFISVAEETGLIIEMGAWVLGEACRTVVAFDDRCLQPLRVSVNLSARQLMEDSLLGSVSTALSSSGLAPERLTLEITESVLLADALATVERLEALRRLGVKVAIDDFGTGYSSLGYLRRLPLDSVKIDRTFIERLADDPRQAALVRSIVELCRSLELETVAEGVETESQARRLLELGCEMAQGFHLGRPMPIEEVVSSMTGVRVTAGRRTPDDAWPRQPVFSRSGRAAARTTFVS